MSSLKNDMLGGSNTRQRQEQLRQQGMLLKLQNELKRTEKHPGTSSRASAAGSTSQADGIGTGKQPSSKEVDEMKQQNAKLAKELREARTEMQRYRDQLEQLDTMVVEREEELRRSNKELRGQLRESQRIGGGSTATRGASLMNDSLLSAGLWASPIGNTEGDNGGHSLLVEMAQSQQRLESEVARILSWVDQVSTGQVVLPASNVSVHTNIDATPSYTTPRGGRGSGGKAAQPKPAAKQATKSTKTHEGVTAMRPKKAPSDVPSGSHPPQEPTNVVESPEGDLHESKEKARLPGSGMGMLGSKRQPVADASALAQQHQRHAKLQKLEGQSSGNDASKNPGASGTTSGLLFDFEDLIGSFLQLREKHTQARPIALLEQQMERTAEKWKGIAIPISITPSYILTLAPASVLEVFAVKLASFLLAPMDAHEFTATEKQDRTVLEHVQSMKFGSQFTIICESLCQSMLRDLSQAQVTTLPVGVRRCLRFLSLWALRRHIDRNCGVSTITIVLLEISIVGIGVVRQQDSTGNKQGAACTLALILAMIQDLLAPYALQGSSALHALRQSCFCSLASVTLRFVLRSFAKRYATENEVVPALWGKIAAMLDVGEDFVERKADVPIVSESQLFDCGLQTLKNTDATTSNKIEEGATPGLRSKQHSDAKLLAENKISDAIMAIRLLCQLQGIDSLFTNGILLGADSTDGGLPMTAAGLASIGLPSTLR